MSERQFATWDLTNAVRNYSSLIISQLAIAAFSFASVWLLTLTLGVEGYGGIVAVIIATQILQILVGWTSAALARYGVEEFVETGSINKCFWARAVIFGPNVALLLALSFLWMPLLSSWLKLPEGVGGLLIVYFVVAAVWQHFQNALAGVKMLHSRGVLLAFERVLIFAILVLLAFTANLNIQAALIAYIGPAVIMSICAIWYLRGVISWRAEIDREWLARTLKFSLPLIPAFLAINLSTNYIDAVFISQYLSHAALGIYSIAYQFNGMLLQFCVLAGALLLPLFVTLDAQKDTAKVRIFMEDILPILTVGVGLGLILIVLIADAVLPIFFGDRGPEIVSILIILSFSTAFAAPFAIGYLPYLNFRSATYVWSAHAATTAVVNIAVDALLIPQFGLVGAAWASVAAQGLALFVVMAIIHRKFSLRLKWTIPALLPISIAVIYGAAFGNLFVCFLIAIALTGLVLLIYRRSFVPSLRLLLSFRQGLLPRISEK